MLLLVVRVCFEVAHMRMDVVAFLAVYWPEPSITVASGDHYTPTPRLHMPTWAIWAPSNFPSLKGFLASSR